GSTAATTAGTVNINTGAAAHVLNVGSASAGNMTFTIASGSTFAIVGSGGTINIGHDAAANTIAIGNGAAANTVTVGSTSSTSSLTLQAGTGATGLKLNAAGNVQMVPATSSTASPTASVTMNNRVGVATFTGFTTASGSTQSFTITNSTILTTSGVIVTVANLNASAAGAEMTLLGVTQAAGSIIVNTKNNGGGALGAGDNVL